MPDSSFFGQALATAVQNGQVSQVMSATVTNNSADWAVQARLDDMVTRIVLGL
jgi:hypothetical protein